MKHRMEITAGGEVVRHFIGDQLAAEIPVAHEDQYRDSYQASTGAALPSTVEVAPSHTAAGAVDLNALVAAEVKRQTAKAKK